MRRATQQALDLVGIVTGGGGSTAVDGGTVAAEGLEGLLVACGSAGVDVTSMATGARQDGGGDNGGPAGTGAGATGPDPAGTRCGAPPRCGPAAFLSGRGLSSDG